MLGIEQIARMAAEEARKEQQLRVDGTISMSGATGFGLSRNKLQAIGATKEKVLYNKKILK